MNRAPLSLSFTRWIPLLPLIMLTAAAPRLVAADAPPAADPVVELPKFVVTDDRLLPPPESWRYAEMPGFEILTNASDRSTQRLIKDFNMFKEALSIVWPIPTRTTVPTSLILCGKGGKFDSFLPPADKSGVDRATASRFLRNKDQTAIVIDLEATTLNVLAVDTANDAATGTDSNIISVDHDKQLYREYVHYLLSGGEQKLPPWLEEGMAQIIMAMKVDPKFIVFGELEDPNTVSASQGAVMAANALTAADDPDGAQLAGAPAEDRDFNAALRRRALLSMDKLFGMAADSPEALNPLGNNIWAKQCYAFVHMCLYGRNKMYQKPFATFLQRLNKEPASETLFKECFKMDYKKMQLELRGYIDFSDYKRMEFTLKKGDSLGGGPALVLRDATQAEVGRIKGEALVLAGYNDKAKIELTAPYIRGERDPQLLAAIGLYDRVNGEEKRGRTMLEAAVKAGTTRSQAYYEVARYRFADALAKPGEKDRFSNEQVKAILAPLTAASKLRPALPEIFELMADTWSRSPVLPTKDEMKLMIAATQAFSTRLRMIFIVADLAKQTDMLDVAHPLADYGIRVAPDPKTRARFEQLKASLPPLPPEAATATATKAGTPAQKR
jgi:hypothetical protein